MAVSPLGRLEKVDLRLGWSNEAGEFTPWLAQAENLALLGDAVGLDLELEAQEKNVGNFRADILCKDTLTDTWVLIENQLERTDHSHLGQLITYAAGLDAVTIVWIAHRFTEEHRAALDWLNEVTDEAINSSIAESGDDPILLSFGITVPLWRDKYDAGVREAIARRLAVSHERADQVNRITASIQRAWFEHTDADRRVRLFEMTLIPKAEESLRASLTGFRAGETSFLDLLDTERTLLEFAVSAERARADRGQALARLHRLVGEAVPTRTADDAEATQNEDAGVIPDEETP